MPKIRRALISVTDKTALVPFVRPLVEEFGVETISTGGTAKLLAESGIPVSLVSDYTGFPEMMDGRVKTLHPKVHAGILASRDNPAHRADMERHGIPEVDLIVCNLYAFERTVAKPGCTDEMAIESIDIGGPSMIRGAAKNYRHVTVVTDPADYDMVLDEMRANEGWISVETNRELARKAFVMTARYDGAIGDYFGRPDGGGLFGKTLHVGLDLGQTLRYGENPHQQGAFYQLSGRDPMVEQFHGKPLSYNNVLDVHSAVRLILPFMSEVLPVVAICKHTTPCAIAVGKTVWEAFERAYQTDPESPFGGVIICTRACDATLATRLNEIFTEVVIAPVFTPEALELLKKRKDRRLIRLLHEGRSTLDIRSALDGFLVQEPDKVDENLASCPVVTERSPTPAELDSLSFAWRAVAGARSNAVVFAATAKTLAIGSGSPARVHAVRVARDNADEVGIPLNGSALASEAFFPFRDAVDMAVKAGARAIVQPGGSKRDQEVIAAADEHGIAMVFTGVRHFRH